MKTIDEDIRNKTFKPCYLLYGEEAYLKKQYKNKLISAMVSKEDTMNFSVFEGKEIVPGKLIDLAETLPFFAKRRVILVEESGFFKNTCEMLADYLLEISPGSVFVFAESEIDKRSKMFKAVKKAGAVVEFETQKETLITKWILGRIGKENKKITKDVLLFFLGRTGLDMNVIDKELEKLFCYTMKKEVIEAADVEAVVTEQLENKIFELVDAVAEHNRQRALKCYDSLLALKEAPLRILFLVIRQFRMLLELKELDRKGYHTLEIAKRTGMPEFAVRKNLSQAKHFTKGLLIKALQDGAKAEEAVKMGQLNDKMAVEIFIVTYSAK